MIAEPRIQTLYDLFVAEVVAAWAYAENFSDGHWHFASDRPRSLRYIAGGSFFETGNEVNVKRNTFDNDD